MFLFFQLIWQINLQQAEHKMQPWKGAQQQIAFIKNTPRDCLRDQKTTTKKRVHAESVSVITHG